MSSDPFKAPTANVADPDNVPRDREPRPPPVTLACRLLWATVVLDLLSLVPGVRAGLWSGYDETPGAVVVAMVFVLVMTGIEIWLIRLVAHRHGWARWALLIYLITGWLMTFSDFSESIGQGMAAVVIDLSTGIAEVVAICLLFLSNGRFWFGKPGASG